MTNDSNALVDKILDEQKDYHKDINKTFIKAQQLALDREAILIQELNYPTCNKKERLDLFNHYNRAKHRLAKLRLDVARNEAGL